MREPCAACPVDRGVPCPAITRPHPRFCDLAALGARYHAIIRAGSSSTRPGQPGTPGRLVVRGYGDSSSGYGRMTAHLMKALHDAGIAVGFEPIHLDETQLPLDPVLVERINNLVA